MIFPQRTRFQFYSGDGRAKRFPTICNQICLIRWHFIRHSSLPHKMLPRDAGHKLDTTTVVNDRALSYISCITLSRIRHVLYSRCQCWQTCFLNWSFQCNTILMAEYMVGTHCILFPYHNRDIHQSLCNCRIRHFCTCKKKTQYVCNIILRRFRAAIVAVDKQYLLHIASVLNLRYLACNARANFSTLSYKRYDFRKKVMEHKMCVFGFACTVF